MRISEDKVFFILSERIGDGGAQIWCELQQSHFFDEYAMEGVSQEANEIYLEIVPDLILRSLKTAQSAKWVKIKLTKKHTPCLTLEIDLPSGGLHQRQVVHDVPVTVVARKHWESFTEPEMPKFDVSISLPPLKVLKNVIDKMKNLSNYVALSANSSGDMKLSVETDMVAVSTHFQNLLNPIWKVLVVSHCLRLLKTETHKNFLQQELTLENLPSLSTASRLIPTKLFAILSISAWLTSFFCMTTCHFSTFYQLSQDEPNYTN
ncbi:unnamed protein product [Lymnaea stagnalis]|uniref:Checkpoint protein n=1 Tax=Lymnaea stagnalis TaxID=6523 RepID=A0AAV2IC56_LYMST